MLEDIMTSFRAEKITFIFMSVVMVSCAVRNIVGNTNNNGQKATNNGLMGNKALTNPTSKAYPSNRNSGKNLIVMV